MKWLALTNTSTRRQTHFSKYRLENQAVGWDERSEAQHQRRYGYAMSIELLTLKFNVGVPSSPQPTPLSLGSTGAIC